jgi:hypothetical protein
MARAVKKVSWTESEKLGKLVAESRTAMVRISGSMQV